MPTLPQLRAKWFLDFGSTAPSYPPAERYSGSAVKAYTDGNLVTSIVDGKDYMKIWHDSIRAMIGAPGAAVYHSGWRFEDVRTLGATTGPTTSDAVTVLKDAHAGGVAVHLLASRHGGGIAPSGVNFPALNSLITAGIYTAYWDNRFPLAGSNHHKFACFRHPTTPKVMLGSIDVSYTRWDTSDHLAANPDRPPPRPFIGGAPTHDTAVQIEGPAVEDVERSFVERWNDSSRVFGLEPWGQGSATIPSVSTPAPIGTHSVQVLHTYGRTSKLYGYSWSPTGDFTIWSSYLNAIRQASTYIYIEDQYFWAFAYPNPCHTRPAGNARNSDIMFQLGEAIKRGVTVIVLVPDRSEDFGRDAQVHQRSLAVNYLATTAAAAAAGAGKFIVASLWNGQTPVMVHSKLLIVDDEFVLIGSANVNQRSMTCDGEIDAGIVDEAGIFARDFRDRIWTEHLEVPVGSLTDLPTALAAVETSVATSSARLHPYPTAVTPVPSGQGFWMTRLHDPYCGPRPR
ncbi:phospholipase D family protein [Solirubrobacter taibaiensis]|nr:phospholipase D family protein [Solirubrobacter taibaiensis]